jgi:hypothetical protein
MNFIQIVSLCLAISSVFMVAYVSISNYNATKKINRNDFSRIDLN